MKRLAMILLASVVAVQLGCAGGAAVGDLKALPGIERVAVVSLAVSDLGGSVKSGAAGGGNVEELMQQASNKMLVDTEERLAKKFSVVKASEFVAREAYRKQGVDSDLTVFVPEVGGQGLALFTQASHELKRGHLDPGKARVLCQVLEVDGVFVIFSEWTVKVGGWVPLTKALTKNYAALWDAQGQKVFARRVDKMGNRTLGAWGVKAMIPETVGQWTGTYKQSLDLMLQ